MTTLRTTVAAAAATLVLGSFAVAGVTTANADEAAPCAKQQAQLDKATAKYDALQQKFAEHPTKKNKKAKKAQVQRVAHAQARLDKCTAGSEEPTETPAA
jgi:hypothetical protein